VDLSGVIFNGTLTGPYIPWSKSAAMKALNDKIVTGSGFTFSIGNGFVLGGSLSIGSYTDPKASYQVSGLSIGWEGFRGVLNLDPESFSITHIVK